MILAFCFIFSRVNSETTIFSRYFLFTKTLNYLHSLSILTEDHFIVYLPLKCRQSGCLEFCEDRYEVDLNFI